MTPARRHFERTMAEARSAEAPATRTDANSYELMLAKLTEDRRRLHDIQSIERKIEVKREILPEYEPWVEGVLAGDHGVQDDVLMTVMVWRVDVGDLAGALQIAAYALVHDLAMPDQYKRTTGCLIAEEFADSVLKSTEPIPRETTEILMTTAEALADQDMPDEVRAKLMKAIGYGLDQLGNKEAAKEALTRALELHEKVGVKKDIERIEREIKNSAGSQKGAG